MEQPSGMLCWVLRVELCRYRAADEFGVEFVISGLISHPVGKDLESKGLVKPEGMPGVDVGAAGAVQSDGFVRRTADPGLLAALRQSRPADRHLGILVSRRLPVLVLRTLKSESSPR